MKQLILNIDNPVIENVLFNLSKKQDKSEEVIAINLLKQIAEVLKQEKNIELKYKKLNPEKFLETIDYKLEQEVETSNEYPFATIDDSARYINEIRKNTWRK